jgi:glycosyltransferase involved in cell wall biosynthesis
MRKGGLFVKKLPKKYGFIHIINTIKKIVRKKSSANISNVMRSELPLVSVLIPAYNRPHYLRLALESALGQTYRNIEIIVCDDSTNNEVRDMMAPYVAKYPFIQYVKNEKVLFVENWKKCFQLASGEYINYLMDDDLFHPQKIEKMLPFFLERDDISLVTSFRQLIDGVGNPLPPLEVTQRLYEETTIIDGIELGNRMLTTGWNLVGEPTTVLFRKKDLGEPYGIYRGKQYTCLNDTATWISLLSKGNAVYYPEALSYFRLHPSQNSNNTAIVATAISGWTELIDQARHDGFLNSGPLLQAALLKQRGNLQWLRTTDQFKAYESLIDEVLQRIESILQMA